MAGWGFDCDDDDPVSAVEKANIKSQARFFLKFVQTSDLSVGHSLITEAFVCELNRLAVEGISGVDNPGKLRERDLTIDGSRHEPPPWQDVPVLMNEMFRYLHGIGPGRSGHAAAYLMWRLNWIHPFEEGNGRTARAAVYVLVCVAAGGELPGEPTFLEMLAHNKIAYFRALESADRAFQKGRIDVDEMQELIERLVYAQIEQPSQPDMSFQRFAKKSTLPE